MPLSLFSGHAAISVFSLVRAGLQSLMVAGRRGGCRGGRVS
jgi:hypothetical protein